MRKKPILLLALSMAILLPSQSYAKEQSTIVITKDEGINLVSLSDEEINQAFEKLLKDGKTQLDKGDTFNADKNLKKASIIKEKHEKALEEENVTEYKTLNLRLNKVIKKKEELSVIIEKMKKASYEDAEKIYKSLDLGELEKAYEEDFISMNEVLRKKKIEKNNDDVLKETEEKIKKLKDEEYKDADKILKEIKIDKATKEQDAKLKELKSYPEKMKTRAEEKKKEETKQTEIKEETGGKSRTVTYTYSVDDENFEGIVKGAYDQLGKPYVYGTSDPNRSFDCSGLTHYLYRTYFGINLPRSAAGQASVGKTVTDLKQGDLLFFNTGGGIGHVGIYVGNGKMIHASTPQTGVRIDNINGPWYAERLAVAKRIVE